MHLLDQLNDSLLKLGPLDFMLCRDKDDNHDHDDDYE